MKTQPPAPTPILVRGSSRVSNGSNVTWRDSETPPVSGRMTPPVHAPLRGGSFEFAPQIPTRVSSFGSAPAQMPGRGGSFEQAPSVKSSISDRGVDGPITEQPITEQPTAFQSTATTGGFAMRVFRSLKGGMPSSESESSKRLGGGQQMQRSHFKWLQKVDESRGITDADNLRGAITPAELGSKYGVPGQKVVSYLREEIAESDSCMSMPFTLLMVIAYTFAVLLHDPGVGALAVEQAIEHTIEHNMFYAYTAPDIGHREYDDVNTYQDFWSWLIRGFIPRIFQDEEQILSEIHGNPTRSTGVQADGGMFLHYNRVIGGVRFTQEVSDEQCVGPSDLARFKGAECVGGYAYELLPEMWEAFTTTDPQREFWLWTSDSLDAQLEKAYERELSGWLDPKTKKIEIAIPVFNAEHKIYTLMFVNFWMSRGGRIWEQVIHMSTYASWWHGPHNIVFDVIWLTCMVWITVTETIKIRRIYRLGGFHQLRIDYINFWTILDWSSLIISVVMVTLFILRLNETASLNSQLVDLSTAEPGTPTYQQRVREFVLHLDAEVHATYELRVFLGLYPALNILRLFKAFASQPRLAIVTRTLYASSVDLIHFLLVFLSVFITYAISGVVLFGREVDGMTTLGRSLITLFRACVIANFEYEEWQLVGRHEAGFFFVSFMAIMTMLMLNMLLAIVMGTYSEQKSKIVASDTLVDETWQAYTRWRNVRRGTHQKLRAVLKGLNLHLAGAPRGPWHAPHPQTPSPPSEPGMPPPRRMRKATTKESLGSYGSYDSFDPHQLITVDLLKAACPNLQTEQAKTIIEATIFQVLEEDKAQADTDEMLREMRKLELTSRRLKKRVESANAKEEKKEEGRRNSFVMPDVEGDVSDTVADQGKLGQTDGPALSAFQQNLSLAKRRLAEVKDWVGDSLVQSGYAQMAVLGPLPDMTIADQPFQSLDELPDWGVAKVLDREEAVLNACRLVGIGREFDSIRVQCLGKHVRVLQKDSEDNTVKCRLAGVGDVWIALGALCPVPQPGIEQKHPADAYMFGTAPSLHAEHSTRTLHTSYGQGGGEFGEKDSIPSPQLSSALAPSEETVKRAAELMHELKLGKHTVSEAMKALQELQRRQWLEQEEKTKVAMKFQQLKKKVVSLTKEHRRMQEELRKLDERIVVVGDSKDEYMDLVHSLLDDNRRIKEKLEAELGHAYAGSASKSGSSNLTPQRLAIEMPLTNRYRPPAEAYTPTTETTGTPPTGRGNGAMAEYGALMERVQRLAAGLVGGDAPGNMRDVTSGRYGETQRGAARASSGSSEISPSRIVQELGQLRNEVALMDGPDRDRLGGTRRVGHEDRRQRRGDRRH